jgi:hypothetical protein
VSGRKALPARSSAVFHQRKGVHRGSGRARVGIVVILGESNAVVAPAARSSFALAVKSGVSTLRPVIAVVAVPIHPLGAV